jgi:hypothetical protein
MDRTRGEIPSGARRATHRQVENIHPFRRLKRSSFGTAWRVPKRDARNFQGTSCDLTEARYHVSRRPVKRRAQATGLPLEPRETPRDITDVVAQNSFAVAYPTALTRSAPSDRMMSW